MLRHRHLLMLVLLLTSGAVHAMGLRSFVALPVDKGGTVLRVQSAMNFDADSGLLVTSLAHGLAASDALLIGLPYQLDQGGADDFGDLSLLYRPTVLQQDSAGATIRVALLGGIVVSTDVDRDGAVQGGLVTTLFRDRQEVDFDILYQAGMSDRPDSGRYDLSWQYRLAPATHPEWGFEREWFAVLELGGRWQEGNRADHQLTLGLQQVFPRIVLEGGITKSLVHGTSPGLLLSVRFHF